MSFTDLPADIKEILRSQQQQIAQLSEMMSGLSEACLATATLTGKLQEHIVGQAAAFQVFAEVVISASPELRQHIGSAMAQLIARPDATPNEHMREMIVALHKAAT
jgi:hypothetical protein